MKNSLEDCFNIIEEEEGKPENQGEYRQAFAEVKTAVCFLTEVFIHPYWKFWLRAEPTFGGLVHFKPENALQLKGNVQEEPFWRSRVVPDDERVGDTAWGDVSLVHAELKLYEVARRMYPNATHFFFLSGDSFPMRTPGYIKDFLANMQQLSIVRVCEDDPDYVCEPRIQLIESLQFKLLHESQVSFLLDARHREGSIFKSLLDGVYVRSCLKKQDLPAPDEVFIQTALFHQGLLGGANNMNGQVCGFKGEFHAKKLTQNEMHSYFNDMLLDKPDEFFFVRKVMSQMIPSNIKILYNRQWAPTKGPNCFEILRKLCKNEPLSREEADLTQRLVYPVPQPKPKAQSKTKKRKKSKGGTRK